jgi:hypothetical protein
MDKLTRRAVSYSSALILSLSLGTGGVLSQPKAAEERGPDIRLRAVSFSVREFQSTPSPLKMLEVHIEIFNKSRQTTAPPNSVKLVLVPKEITYLEGAPRTEFNPGQQETTIAVPLPPNTGRILTFGFSLPEKIPESMTFEIQMNPPEGETKTVTYSLPQS